MGRELGIGERATSAAVAQDPVIFLSPDAVTDVERLRTFLDQNNPEAARRALAFIWSSVQRLQEFPHLGMPTEDAEIRQIVLRFGASGYIVRYIQLRDTEDILITRVWHGREARI